jgi:hypothetical protein
VSYPVYTVPSGDVLPIFFSTYGRTNGESITASGLAVTDIEIYKDGSVTQRASDAGYTLLDTDGLDFDGVTGIHGFSIDTGDNTDAGFYTVGAWFHVVVSAVTVDSQAVSFIAAAFRLMAAESVAAKPKADVDAFGGTAGTFSGGRPEVNTTHAAGTAWGSGAITAASIAADAITAAKIADGAIDAGAFAADAITAAKLAADVTTELQSGLATAAALATVDTVVDAIKAVTDLLPDAGALTSLATQASVNTIDDFLDTEIAAILEDTGTTLDDFIDTEIAAIKAQTDKLTFNASNQLTADLRRINNTVVNGDGGATPWGP